MALKILLAARDGEIDGDEINAILDSVKAIYDIVLIMCALLFSMLLPFCFSDGAITPDPWLSAGAANVLQKMFVVSAAVTTVLFLSPMCVVSFNYFNLLLIVTTSDKVRGYVPTEAERGTLRLPHSESRLARVCHRSGFSTTCHYMIASK